MVHPGPDFSVADVFAGWFEAFKELGVEVAPFNLNDRLVFYSTALVDTHETDETGHPIVKQYLTQDQAFTMALQGLTHAVYSFWPDVIFFVSAFFTTAGMFSLLRSRQHKVVILHTESPYQEDEQIMRGEMADLNLLNDPANLEAYRAMGIPARYQHHCYRPSVHFPRPPSEYNKPVTDLAFIGTAFKSRIGFFEAMAPHLEGLDCILAGNDWGKLPLDSPLSKYIGTGAGEQADCVTNADAAALYRNTRMGINFYRREGEATHEKDIAVAMGPREIEQAACGLPFLRDRRPEGDEVLHMLPRFDGPEDAATQLRWWLAHEAEREKIAGQARAAIQDRTFLDSAKRLLTELDGL